MRRVLTLLPSVNMMSKVVVGRVPLLRPNGLDWSYPVSEEGVRMISDPSESILRSLELHLNYTAPLGHLVTSGDSFSSLTSTDFPHNSVTFIPMVLALDLFYTNVTRTE